MSAELRQLAQQRHQPPADAFQFFGDVLDALRPRDQIVREAGEASVAAGHPRADRFRLFGERGDLPGAIPAWAIDGMGHVGHDASGARAGLLEILDRLRPAAFQPVLPFVGLAAPPGEDGEIQPGLLTEIRSVDRPFQACVSIFVVGEGPVLPGNGVVRGREREKSPRPRLVFRRTRAAAKNP